MAQPLPLQSLGRYQIVSELGRGAMGTVYQGLDATIERPVALKTLNAELPGDIMGEVKERFLREARSAGKLNHPNIVTIYEFGEDQGTAFIAMEFLEGKSLQDVIRAGRLPFATIADIVAQIADALDYAHRFGVVHRDIKPANIMLSSHGLAKLTDFGIARIQSSSMTQTGAMLGSPKYMSPEQVLGQQADGRADIFSLGVVLYEMLASKTPFETPDVTVFSLMQRIVTVPQPSVVSVAPDTPPAFDAILAKALAKRPEARYQRASEFANDLRNFKAMAPGTDKTTLIDRTEASAMRAASVATASSPAPAASSAFEPTVITNPQAAQTLASAPPGKAATSDPALATHVPSTPIAASTLLGNLDTLGADLDELQRRVADEEAAAVAAIRQEGQRSQHWDQMARGMELPPAKHEQPAASAAPGSTSATGPGAAPGARSSVFDLLRKQTGPNLKQQGEAMRTAEAAAMLAFDAKLRAGYLFLSEFFREVKAAAPQYTGKHTLPYLGAFPPMYISEGVVNARTRRIEHDGKIRDVIDHMPGSYFLVSNNKQRITVNAAELSRVKQLLEDYEIPFDMTAIKDDFNQVRRATLDVQMKFICAFNLRADYAAQAVELTSRNIGDLGRRRFRIPADAFEVSLLEEFSKLILGYPTTALDPFVA